MKVKNIPKKKIRRKRFFWPHWEEGQTPSAMRVSGGDDVDGDGEKE